MLLWVRESGRDPFHSDRLADEFRRRRNILDTLDRKLGFPLPIALLHQEGPRFSCRIAGCPSNTCGTQPESSQQGAARPAQAVSQGGADECDRKAQQLAFWERLILAH